LLLLASPLSAQLTYGTTGLLHVPSAEMQRDKSFMFGANFLNKEITPATWYYHTYNYFVNITFLSCLEVAYVSTLIRAEAMKLEGGLRGFTNQDRYFALRLRLLKEGQFWKHMPAVVLGTSDPYTGSGRKQGQIASTARNGYFSRFYLAATKHLLLGKEDIGIHLSYLYNRRVDYPLNGVAAGISYNPSFHPALRFIVEYDTHDVAVGATYLLFGHLHAQVEFQRMKYFTGGLTCRLQL
jgi:hypothetical protein